MFVAKKRREVALSQPSFVRNNHFLEKSILTHTASSINRDKRVTTMSSDIIE